MSGKTNKKSLVLAGLRVCFAALIIAAVAVQFLHGRRSAGFSPANFFSFFTIESNILMAVLFLVMAIAGRGRRSATLDFLRGAATLYMVITGVVYALLLSNLSTELQTTIPWVNDVLHRWAPVVILADWLIDRPRQRVAFRTGLWWIIFPTAYATYSLVRGLFVHWYPYPFLNPTEGGYGKVAAVSAGIAVAVVAMVWLLTMISGGRRFSRKHRTTAQ